MNCSIILYRAPCNDGKYKFHANRWSESLDLLQGENTFLPLKVYTMQDPCVNRKYSTCGNLLVPLLCILLLFCHFSTRWEIIIMVSYGVCFSSSEVCCLYGFIVYDILSCYFGSFLITVYMVVYFVCLCLIL